MRRWLLKSELSAQESSIQTVKPEFVMNKKNDGSNIANAVITEQFLRSRA